MHLDPMMLNITIVLFIALSLGFLAVRSGLPIVIAYIITGIIVGPSLLGLISDTEIILRLGELGVVMLLFFVGMEVSIPALLQRWRVAVIGTGVQILLSVAVCTSLVWSFDLPTNLGILFGFAISLSSTAVVLKILQDSGELELPFGQNALGVLLVQDISIVPMMIVLSMLGNGEANPLEITKQVVGGIAVLAVVIWLMRTGKFKAPAFLTGSLEKRILSGLVLCFGAASLTSWLGLSPGLGAFLSGMMLASSDQSKWVHEHLESVHILFVAVFFLSIGLLVDLSYLIDHLWIVAGATLLVFVFNSGTNVFVMKALGEPWEEAILTAGLLSQIGEFSFLLAAVGLHAGIVEGDLYKLLVLVIALTLLLSPVWMLLVKRLAIRDGVAPIEPS